MTTATGIRFPADPFGIRATERSAWAAFSKSGAFDALLRRFGCDPTRAAHEHLVMRARLDGAPIPATPGFRPLACIATLRHLLRPAEAEGLDIGPVMRAIERHEDALRSPMRFMTGRCHELALAGHARCGWPIGIIVRPSLWSDGAAVAQHVFLVRGGHALDVLGLRPLVEVCGRYGASPEEVGLIGPEELRARGDLAGPVDLDEAAAHFDIVTGRAFVPTDEAGWQPACREPQGRSAR